MSLSPLSGSTLEELKHDRDRFVAFAFASSDMLIEIDKEHNITYIDGATFGFLGDNYDTLKHQPVTKMIADGQEEKWQKILSDIKKHGRVQQRKITLSSRTFAILPTIVSGVMLPDNNSSIFLSFSILRDEINENEIGARDIETGLFNKEEYAKLASKRIKELTDAGIETRISLIDLPDLKEFIDNLEPEKARDLTLEISSYMRSKSIGNDTAGIVDDGVYSFVHDNTLASDEVIGEVMHLLSRLAPDLQNNRARISMMDGDAGNLNEGDSARAILYTLNHFAESDENFNFESISNSYNAMLSETVERITSFKNTIEDSGFDLAFQPIVDLRNGIVHHYEVLVRLHENNDNKFSNPFHFITFGEQTGLVSEFDMAMCQRTLDVLERAHKDSRWPLVAINLSGKSLSSQLFMDTIQALLAQYPHIRKQVILEVTESAKITDMEATNRFLQELRKAGHTCCLDDFGVAESSFDYLRYLHVDYIKIDGSYVRENLTTTRGRHLLRAMVGMCRNLGMTTIGEMVEDKKIAAILWESGVHYGQGWLFGKPDTDEETLKLWNLQSPNFDGMMRNKKEDDNDKKDGLFGSS